MKTLIAVAFLVAAAAPASAQVFNSAQAVLDNQRRLDAMYGRPPNPNYIEPQSAIIGDPGYTRYYRPQVHCRPDGWGGFICQ